MRGSWVLALAAGTTLVMAAPSGAEAQSGGSIRDRWEQTARRSESDRDRDGDRARERDRDRERARAEERDRDRARAAERERDRDRDRARSHERERERVRARERERERLRARERELERERERLRERERQLERERERLRELRRREHDRDHDDRYRRTSSRNGPAFCRSGEGHPRYGREWCRQKGYEVGRGRGWERERWGNIVYRDSNRRRNHRYDRSELASLLGNSLVNRFESHGRQYGSGPVTGYWLPEDNGVLQLSVGGTPIARLVDTNSDRHVDYLLLRR
jgi:hypothetical protein